MLSSANTQAGPVESCSQRDAGCAGALLVTLTSLHVQGRDHAWTTMRGLCSRSSLCSSLAQRPNRGWDPAGRTLRALASRLLVASLRTPSPRKQILVHVARNCERTCSRGVGAGTLTRRCSAMSPTCFRACCCARSCRRTLAASMRPPCALPESEGQEHELQRCVLGVALEDTFS